MEIGNDQWRPRCATPRALVVPVPIDPDGEHGPTRGQAAGPRWRRTSPGLYVPVETSWSVEQRIVEAAGHLPPGGMVTGWAALRLLRGALSTGSRDGSTELPVTLLLPHSVRLAARPGVVLRRAVIDAMVEADDDRKAVVVTDMAAAAEITSPHRVAVFLASDGRACG